MNLEGTSFRLSLGRHGSGLSSFVHDVCKMQCQTLQDTGRAHVCESEVSLTQAHWSNKLLLI